MHGTRIVFLLILCVFAAVACKKVPTAASQNRAKGVPILGESNKLTPPPVQLTRMLAAYEWEPTAERAAAVWDAFAELDTRIGDLSRIVSSRTGGVRAEAEIERIELQRLRDHQMARFANTQTRLRTARAAFDALTDGDGLRAAASMVMRGTEADARFSTRELRHGRYGIPAQVQ